ncbi:methyltransferase domain-containing protein [Frischella sp. Ac48]|uniref:tRNA 5-carboxymethoxyuridine methyltransferase n=1 Tax=Frischella japonica TaxID=2741544 RepID=A0ABR7QUY8_9GAMM|nr:MULTISPECIES: methyltransferase domain-containing protein [Frischella]MBC9130041.1 methyltransferase domain-containing protein [Frischella japonica]MBX4133024.1 methyltransferase domain-containing protein [Frischella sp. Ac48]
MDTDRNFDDITDKFAQNIYGTTKGKIREIIVWQDIEKILALFPKQQKLTILDAGGGQGQIACKLAKLGHDVTICDISAQMLEVAKNHAQTQFVTLNYLNKAIQDLPAEFAQSYDIVICHAVLEWVNNGKGLIYALKQLLKPSGFLSLMFYNLHGLLFRTVTLGNFGYVQMGLNKRKKKTLSPDYPRNPDEVYQWLSEFSLRILEKTGIRVFHDYMLDKSKQQNRFNELLELEKKFCRQEPYLQLARYIHVIAQ